jgi:hypothetical protein
MWPSAVRVSEPVWARFVSSEEYALMRYGVAAAPWPVTIMKNSDILMHTVDYA